MTTSYVLSERQKAVVEELKKLGKSEEIAVRIVTSTNPMALHKGTPQETAIRLKQKQITIKEERLRGALARKSQGIKRATRDMSQGKKRKRRKH